MVFFLNRNSLPTTPSSPTTYCVSDSIVTFTPAPTPHSRSWLWDTHKFMDFFRNRNTLVTSSSSPTTFSVSDNMVTFTPVPTSRSRWPLSHTHNIHTLPPPSPHPRSSRSRVLRSFGFFRVWPGLVPPVWPLDPFLGLLLFLPVQPSVYEEFRSLHLVFSLSLYRHLSMYSH